MYPTLNDGLNLSLSITKSLIDIKRGDIVSTKQGVRRNDNERLSKRVIGVPGDRIVITSDTIYINSVKYETVFNHESIFVESVRIFTLRENEYLIMGDNYDNSSDSRYFGIINKNKINFLQLLEIPIFSI